MSSYFDIIRDIQLGDLAHRAGRRAPSGLRLEVAAVSDEDAILPLLDVKDFIKTTSDDEDATIDLIRQGIRDAAERVTGRLFSVRQVTAEWNEVYRHVVLPKPPFSSLTSIERYDVEDEQYEAVSSDDYYQREEVIVLEDSNGGKPLKVVYDAGFSSVPPALKLQMLRDIRRFYEHRDNRADGGVELYDPSLYNRWKTYR